MEALTENRNVRQRPEEGFRRWFLNEYFDLIFWYESAQGELTGFQLCYSRNVTERAFSWYRNKRGSHFVSSGADQRGIRSFATAILHGDAGPVPEEVLRRLREEQGELDDDLLELVISAAREYNQREESGQ